MLEELVSSRRRGVNPNRLRIRRNGASLKEIRQLGVINPLLSRISKNRPSIEHNAEGEIGEREVVVIGIQEENEAAVLRND